MEPIVEKWEIAGTITHMAGDMTIHQAPNGFLPSLSVMLQFRAKRLRLFFERVVRYDWKNDSCIGFSFAPNSAGFPRFRSADVTLSKIEFTAEGRPLIKPEAPGKTWVFIYPLLKIRNSPWANAYTFGYGQAEHFVLMSEIGSVEILAVGEIKAEWISPE